MNKELIKKTREFLLKKRSLIANEPFTYMNREHGVTSLIFEKSLEEIHESFFKNEKPKKASRRYIEFLETLIFWGILPIEYESIHYTKVAKEDKKILQEKINVQKSKFRNLEEYVDNMWIEILTREHSNNMFWRKVNTAYHIYLFRTDKEHYKENMIHEGFEEWDARSSNGFSKYNKIIQYLFLGSSEKTARESTHSRLISEILEVNSNTKDFHEYSGKQIMTDWFDFNDKNAESFCVDSWEFVSGNRNEDYLKSTLKEFDSPKDFLYSHKNEIISRWLKGTSNSNFLVPIMSVLSGKIKNNKSSPYDDVIQFLLSKQKVRKFENKNKTLTAMEQQIRSYRQDFKIKMIELYGSKNFVKDSKYIRVDAAHIVEVKTIKNHGKNIGWISESNNGINIEPNIHRMWDRYDIYLDMDYCFKEYGTNNIIWEIQEEFRSSKRTNFIKLRKEQDFLNKRL